MGALKVVDFLLSTSRRDSGFVGTCLILDMGSIRLRSVLRIQE